MIPNEKVHHGDGHLSNGTHTVTMYQHFCGECLVHSGIHVVVVVLYKLVIWIIWGHTGTNYGLTWKIYLYIAILFNICITLNANTHIFSDGSRGAYRKHGNIGLSSLILIFICTLSKSNIKESQSISFRVAFFIKLILLSLNLKRVMLYVWLTWDWFELV